jgi:LCP family protein required for cell wall assembly
MSSSSPRRLSARAIRNLKRSVIAVLVLANVVALVVYWQLRTIESQLDSSVVTNVDVVAQLDPAPDDASEALTFLLIGSDSREGLDDLTNFGNVGGQRADVVMLVQVIAGESRAQILSIPRDLWVDIPGHGEDRVNAAFAIGGAPLMVQTVKAATGIDINHYVEIDFVGFQAMVDELGGVTFNFPYPARDLKSGFRVEAGTQTLDGSQALAYARSRSYQELRDGTWTSVQADDIGRTQRQQQLIFEILSATVRPSNLTETGQIVGALARHMTIDSALAESSIVGLAFDMRGVRPSSIDAMTLPITGTTIGEKSVVLAKNPEAEQTLAAFRSGTSIAAESGTLRVEVLNGNAIAGSAAEWANFLSSAGFEIAGIGDADQKDFQITQIIVRPADQSFGDEVRQALGFGSVSSGTVNSLTDVLVVLGKDVP